MCRRLIIDLEWGNQDPEEEFEDAGVMFDRTKNYNALTDEVKAELTQFLEDRFFGHIGEPIITEIPR